LLPSRGLPLLEGVLAARLAVWGVSSTYIFTHFLPPFTFYSMYLRLFVHCFLLSLIAYAYFVLILIHIIGVVIVFALLFSVCSVSFIVCVELCAVLFVCCVLL
jgi:hypothetical protein